MLPSFAQWLAERGARTALGIYPALYGSGQKPPLAFAPSSAAHAVAFATIHGGEHPELLSPEMRKKYKKNSKKNPIDTMGTTHAEVEKEEERTGIDLDGDDEKGESKKHKAKIKKTKK
jgi:hypothetical protein